MDKGNTHRLIFNMRKFGIEVFEEFGRYNYLNTQAVLPTHTHPGMIEICYLSKGCQEYFVGDRTFKMLGGDVFVTYPDEVHGTGDTPEEKGVLYWMVLKAPRQGEEYLGLSFPEASEIFDRLRRLPARLFKGNAGCEISLRRIINVYFREQSLLAATEMNNLLVSLLLDIIRCGETAHDRKYSECITKTIDYIDENLFGDLTLEGFANRCNLSVSRFKHRFKEETGIPPAEYIIRRKMEQARKLMDDGTFSIKNIAYDLGFSSPAHFSTVFRQYNGCSPSGYRSKKK